MTATKRTQSKIGEREATSLVRELTGWDARRRVRQHDCDSDLMGVPGWSIEVKRHRSASRADIALWWPQAVTQAGELLPVLLYRVDRGDWRAVWPLAVLLVDQLADYWQGTEWTADTSVAALSTVAREVGLGRRPSGPYDRQRTVA